MDNGGPSVSPDEARKRAESRDKRRFPLKKLALAGVYAALLIGGKEALAALPNVEVVTLLCALGGFAFGSVAFVSVCAFVTVEGAIYGFGSWIVSYYVHWPLVCLTFMLLARVLRTDMRARMILIPTAAAFLLTSLFSVLTALADVGLLTGFFENFPVRFAIYYMRGVPFYIAQTATNLIVFPLLFPLLAKTLIFLKKRYYL